MKKSICKVQQLILCCTILLLLIFNCALGFEGDITGNGYVDFHDVAVLNANWLKTGDVNDTKGADINQSGTVDLKDFASLANNWYQTDPNMLGWWKFDELLADQAIDSTGNSNTGIMQNGAVKVASEMGGAIDLDGDDDQVSISNEANFDVIKDKFTVAAWVKAKALKDDMKIASKGSAFCFGRDYDNYFLTFSCDGIGRPISGSMDVFDFEWHHVAAVYDGSLQKIYVDGFLDNSKPASGNITPNDENVLIGSTSVVADLQWWGQIDDLRIYNRALSQEELYKICRPYHLKIIDMVPYDGAQYEPNDVTLSWTPGKLADSYDLYFGTDQSQVENADHSSPCYIGNFPADVNTYNPGILDEEQCYYWRLEHADN